MEPLTYEDFKDIFRSSKRAFHMEMQDSYNISDEDEPFRKWRNSEPDDYEWRRDWLSFIREMADRGITIQRVRIASVPHTDYFRWEIALTPQNIAAGEDVRYLPRHLLEGAKLPEHDCWLFDDDKLVLSIFSEDGRTGGFAREADTGLTAQYRAVRDWVWPMAIPYDDYVS